MYIVTSKPKRISSYLGLVHIIISCVSNEEMFVSKYSLILEAKRELDAELNKTTHTINMFKILGRM